MATKKRCFSSVKTLRRLNPGLLCEVLRKFSEYLAQQGIKLPKDPVEEKMPYEVIRKACMAGDIPHELDDVLFFSSLLGNTAGWGTIQREAEFQKLNLDFKPNGYTTTDLAMKAWLHDWPRNKSLLEQSFARTKIYNRSSYVYYPPTKDARHRYVTPSKAKIKALRDRLSDYFVNEGLGPGTSIVEYDFDKEIWFLVRYPGHVQRHASISDDGEQASHVFKPEEYDAIIYHKGYGDLRLNTNRRKEHIRYRIDFADLLLNGHNVFSPTEKIVRLDPLLGDCAAIFKCKDIDGLGEIAPVEVCYPSLSKFGCTVTLKADKDCTLLTYHQDTIHLLPDDAAHSIQYAKFRYRLANSMRYSTLTVHAGNTLTYVRDGDSSVLEDWLRRRGFIKHALTGKDVDGTRIAQIA